MDARRTTPVRRVRRILSGLLAGALVVLSAGAIVVYGPAERASAAPVDIFSPLEIDQITSASWPFVGTANPGESVTVRPLGGTGTSCTDVADGGGNWSCNVTFTTSGTLIQVQAISFNHLTADSVEDTKEYSVSIEPEITETAPGRVASNAAINPSFSGIADPNATIAGTINGINCGTVASPTGAYTCTAPTVLPGPATYPITVSQTPTSTGFASDDLLFDYVLDQTGPGLSDITDPYDTVASLPPREESTSDPTPSFTGLTEPYGHGFVVYAPDDGIQPPTASPGLALCDAFSDASGVFTCSAALPQGNWSIGTWQQDEAGNTGSSPDGEFILRRLPPPPPPAVLAPAIGYASELTRVHVSTTNLAEGTMYVRDGGADVCPPTPVPVPTFSCDTVPLAPGVHVLSIFQEDQYGTFSPAVQRTVTILAPPAALALKQLTIAFRIIGPDGEVGEQGLSAGDAITIEAEGLPLGAVITAEIHSTPVGLGSATIGPGGALALATTVPDVEAGEHEIVVSGTAPGYAPTTEAHAVQVREVKQIPEPAVEGKELGDPDQHHSGSGAAGGGGAHGFGDPSVFGSSLESPFDAPAHAFALSPAGIVLSGSIAIAFLLLVGLPAELLESTIRSNYDRAFGWIARVRRRAGRIVAPIARALSHPVLGSAVSIVAAAFLLGFADPDFGVNGASVRLLLAMIVAVLAINVGLSLIVMKVAGRAFDVTALLKPMPAALAIVAVSVLVSRLAGISPGFLFGVVLGIAYARELRLRDEARLGVLGAGLTIAAGMVAWVGYGIASAIASGPGFVNNLVIEILAAVTLEALGTLVIALLPIEFLDGRTIFRWSKLAWLGLYLLTLAIFLFVVVPLSDNWGTMSAPIFGWGTLFAVFAAVAIVTWAIFRRASRATPSSPAAETRRPRARR